MLSSAYFGYRDLAGAAHSVVLTSRLAQRQRLVARAVIGRWVNSNLVRSVARWAAAAAAAAADRQWLWGCTGGAYCSQTADVQNPSESRRDARGGRLSENPQQATWGSKDIGYIGDSAVAAAVDVLLHVIGGVWDAAAAAAAAAAAEARSIFNGIDTDGSGTLSGSITTAARVVVKTI